MNTFISRHFWLLFLIIIPATIFDFLTEDLFSGTGLYTLGNIGLFAANLLYGIILIRLSSQYHSYKISGICYIISVLLTGWLQLMGATEFGVAFGSIVLTSFRAILNAIAVYYELSTHSDIISREDYEMSTKWAKLTTYYVFSYVLLLVSIISVSFMPIISFIVIMVASFSILILGIMKFIYLYRTAKFFRRLAKEEIVSRETSSIN